MAQLAQPTCLWEPSRRAKGSSSLARAGWCLTCSLSLGSVSAAAAEHWASHLCFAVYAFLAEGNSWA